MSDLRITAACSDCRAWVSGTSALEWISEHVDQWPDHRIIVTRSGEIDRDMS